MSRGVPELSGAEAPARPPLGGSVLEHVAPVRCRLRHIGAPAPPSGRFNAGVTRLAGAVLLVAATACGGSYDPGQHPTPESLYEASLRSFRMGDCGKARPGFQRLTFELEGSDPRQAEARYYLAECLLDDGDELEAARQFRRVSDEFPRHELAPDALLRAGDANAELWKDPELDPTYGETAVATYQELMGRYPASPAAQRARLRIAELNDMFAEKEFKAGIFYMRLRAYDSAIIYFKEVVARFGQSRFAGPAVVRLVEAFDRIGYDDEKRDMCQYLKRYYPNTEGAAKACPETASSR